MITVIILQLDGKIPTKPKLALPYSLLLYKTTYLY